MKAAMHIGESTCDAPERGVGVGRPALAGSPCAAAVPTHLEDEEKKHEELAQREWKLDVRDLSRLLRRSRARAARTLIRAYLRRLAI